MSERHARAQRSGATPWRRWSMSTFDDGTGSETEETPVETVPDAAEIAAQIDAAQAQARTAGWAAGHREGFAAGEPVG
ncbi:MAG: hypothetical protein JHC61_16900, partial [Burkholderiaceae bacterium]|nr:hypothetical protein [Burkholderiaceae bacterium]